MGLRKVIGAQRKQLIRQFLGESFLAVMIAVAAAFCLVFLLLPLLTILTDIEYMISDLINTEIITGLVVLIFVIGIGAGLYPAFLLSGLRPTQTLKGIYFQGRSRAYIRRTTGQLLRFTGKNDRQFHDNCFQDLCS